MDPDQIIPWMKQYIYGNLAPYVKSEPIPNVNEQPVKVVVADNIDDIVFNSGKSVRSSHFNWLSELYDCLSGCIRFLVKFYVKFVLPTHCMASILSVLLEFYAPWCGHCRKLAPILEEVAVSLQDDEDVVIAKMVLQDGTANDIPTDFAVEGYPTLYFYSSSGDIYNGGKTA